MKQETNNEIDLLLRRVSRRDGGATSGSQIGNQHLDADEMSSYAQNALPAAARARYMEHLAECSACRTVVTELSLSLGATAAAPIETAREPVGLRKFLAGLFSPLVLRYAVPALGVIVVMVVGFVVLRQQRSEELVAQMEPQREEAAAVPEAQIATPSPAAGGAESSERESQSSPKRVNEPRETAPESKAADTAVAAPVAPARDASKDAESMAALRPGVAPTPSPQPPAAPKAAKAAEKEDEKKAEAEANRKPERVAQTADTVSKEQANAAARPATGSVRRAGEVADTRNEPRKSKVLPLESRGVVGGAVRDGAGTRSRTEENRADAETRSVGGRRFRKERGIWIDTAYDSGTATVNMVRGSEQFRGLVADEPAIGRIAEQLDGEIIVVWKGRAYRIR